jgi:hypothetical protein
MAQIGATASTLPPAARQTVASVIRSLLSELPPGSDAAGTARALLRTLAALNGREGTTPESIRR